MVTTNEVSSGIFFDLDNPRAEQVTIHDIAHHLSQICRFNGATGDYYTVAEHSVLVQRYINRHYPFPRLELAALLHDAPETYVGDFTSPVKRKLGLAYRELMYPVEEAVAAAFGLTSGEFHSSEVVEADMVMLQVEAHYLLISGGEGEHWNRPTLPEVTSWELALCRPKCWSPKEARMEFLQAYNGLVTKLRKTPGGTIATYAV